MMGYLQRRQEVSALINTALECSVYISPGDHGLAYAELLEVGTRLGLQEGEISDAIGQLTPTRDRFALGHGDAHALTLAFLSHQPDPDFRNADAFEFVHEQMQQFARSVGQGRARMQRPVLVAKGTAAGLMARDVEVAITVFIIAGILQGNGDLVFFSPSGALSQRPKEALTKQRIPVRGDPSRRQGVFEAVKDVIDRRNRGRPISAEPLQAFEERLDDLGHGRFRLWWARTRGELLMSNGTTTPLTTCVLAAALSEAAITFVVRRAQDLNLATLNSKTFQESATGWKFDKLVSSAASGQHDAILDQKLRDRAERLNVVRNRIHAGRLLAEVPSGPVPDIRPEEARDAVETVNAIVRAVLDWLDKHPGPKS